MKILVISTFDVQGGAARAAYRLHKGLLGRGIDSRMLVQFKTTDDRTVYGPSGKVEKALSMIKPALDALPIYKYPHRTGALFSPSWWSFSGIAEKINDFEPDIVNLQWTCGGMLPVASLARVKAPIVWTLHDMWPFTGGCHYDLGCGGYAGSCGKCKVLASGKERDLSRRGFLVKRGIFEKIPGMTVVAVSRWMAERVGESALLGGKRLVTLPNPVDTAVFDVFDKESSRELWKIPKDRKIVLFGAVNAVNDPRKGYFQLREALKIIPSNDIELVVFGSGHPDGDKGLAPGARYLGHLHDEVSLVSLYNAADVMVVPSLQEAFGQTAAEAMSCGTPVVGFDDTGLADIVDHKKNGYLARPFDPQSLASGIEWVLNCPDNKSLAINARKKAVDSFDTKFVSKGYVDLFEEVLSRGT